MPLKLLSGALATAALVAACGRAAPRASMAASDTGAVTQRASATSDGAIAPVLADTLAERADRGRVMGDTTAALWVVMASDFQCPFCKIWHDSTMGSVVQSYVKTGKVRLAYINFPLGQHRNAAPAAEAAMCASVQGKFWAMHDSLFARQERWGELPNAIPMFDTLATRVGVAMPAWRKCMSTHATAALIQADRDRGAAAGVGSTPTFFIGTRRLAGAVPFAEMRAAIDGELAKARAAKPKPAR
jgi:protein-disulfide isomerase